MASEEIKEQILETIKNHLSDQGKIGKEALQNMPDNITTGMYVEALQDPEFRKQITGIARGETDESLLRDAEILTLIPDNKGYGMFGPQDSPLREVVGDIPEAARVYKQNHSRDGQTVQPGQEQDSAVEQVRQEILATIQEKGEISAETLLAMPPTVSTRAYVEATRDPQFRKKVLDALPEGARDTDATLMHDADVMSYIMNQDAPIKEAVPHMEQAHRIYKSVREASNMSPSIANPQSHDHGTQEFQSGCNMGGAQRGERGASCSF